MSTQGSQQPLHPSLIPILDPEYVKFHNELLQYFPPFYKLPLDPNRHANVDPEPFGLPPLKVGSQRDFVLANAKLYILTPEGVAPPEGWPIFLFFHGGGWTQGNLKLHSYFMTTMCVKARCVVVSVGYRLSPEHPYPAAIDDALEALHWVVEKGKAELDVDVSRIAIGGLSSGAHLTTVLTLKAAELRPPIQFTIQLLFAPIFDNTNDGPRRWEMVPHVPSLGPDAVRFYQRNFLPNEEDRNKWDASPILAPKELMSKAPKTWMALMEVDVLKPEGEEYGAMLAEVGVGVETVVYKGAPHGAMAMTKHLKCGRQIVSDGSTVLAEAFGHDVQDEVVE